DCGCVATIVQDALLPVLTTVCSLAAMFLIMWRLDATLTLLALGVVPCMVVILRLYMVPMEERSYEAQEAEGRLYTLVEQTLSATPVVQAFGREEQTDGRFRATAREILKTQVASTSIDLQFNTLMGLTTTVGT